MSHQMQFLNLEKPYKNKLPRRRDQLQRKKKKDADKKIIISEQKTISSLKGKSFSGKATTKYVI